MIIDVSRLISDIQESHRARGERPESAVAGTTFQARVRSSCLAIPGKVQSRAPLEQKQFFTFQGQTSAEKLVRHRGLRSHARGRILQVGFNHFAEFLIFFLFRKEIKRTSYSLTLP